VVTLAALTSFTPVAHAQDVPMPTEQVLGDVPYMNGGVGEEEVQFIKQTMKDYTLRLAFSARPARRRAEYVRERRGDDHRREGNEPVRTRGRRPLPVAQGAAGPLQASRPPTRARPPRDPWSRARARRRSTSSGNSAGARSRKRMGFAGPPAARGWGRALANYELAYETYGTLDANRAKRRPRVPRTQRGGITLLASIPADAGG